MNQNNNIKIYCQNTQKEKYFPFGTSLLDIANQEKIKPAYPILGAMVNNSLKELDYLIYKPKTVRFIDYTHPDGKRMYMRSLSFILYKAAHDLYPQTTLKIKHSVSNGFYCVLEGLDPKEDYEEVCLKLKTAMKSIVAENLAFEREEIQTDEAVKIFEEQQLFDKCALVKTRQQFYSSVYKMDGVVNYFYGYLVPSTGYIDRFDLLFYQDGMLLLPPKSSNPYEIEEVINQDKLFEVFREFKDWVNIMGVPDIGRLNMATQENKIGLIIKISEALQEKKLASIAEKISAKRKDLKVILISGPSSSGKTTFAKRLSIQLRVIGFDPIILGMDNYFVDRAHTPLDENGELDFESPYAIDIELFNKNMLELFDGKEIELPKFSFASGQRSYDGNKLSLKENSILLVEGIHGLNPIMSNMIPNKRKFKIYVSALTPIGIDSSNRIPTTDNRLIRRIVRDHNYRGYSALDTLQRWASVRKGEEKHIFPFQEEADIMFNTALIYELGVLKNWAEPILRAVPPIAPEYAEARRLLKFLSYIIPIITTEIPPTSILREFLDGSSFKYS